MAVEVANVVGHYANYPSDGMLGLGFQSLSQGQRSNGKPLRTKILTSKRSYSKATNIHGTPYVKIASAALYC